jgi:hypothetical protein
MVFPSMTASPQHKIAVPELVLNHCRITGRPLRCEIREFPPQRFCDVQDGQDFASRDNGNIGYLWS